MKIKTCFFTLTLCLFYIAYLDAQTQTQNLNMGLYQLQFPSANGGNNRIQSYGGTFPGTWLFKSRFDNIHIDAGENSSNSYKIFFKTGGIERARFNSNGNFGIGTTTTSHLLTLGNNSHITDLFKIDGSYSDVTFNGTHTTGSIWSFINSGTGSGTRFYVEDANNSSSRLTFDFKGNGGDTNILAGTSNGNVGLGTITPNTKLHVEGIIGVDRNYGFRFLEPTSDGLRGGIISNDTNDFIMLGAGGTEFARIKGTTGNFGIGTTTPLAKLDIDGGTIRVSHSANQQLEISQDLNADGTAIFDNQASIGDMKFQMSGSDRMIIKRNGNVGIGTTDTQGFRLGVDGKIAATEVKIATYANWPDFVFSEEYNLPSLNEVELYIKNNGHLEDILSAETVEKDGFYLAEMNAKLLQKIEELTLYTIEQQKSLEDKDLKIKKLEERLKKIEDLLIKS